MEIFKALFKAKMHKLLGTETSYAGIHFKKMNTRIIESGGNKQKALNAST